MARCTVVARRTITARRTVTVLQGPNVSLIRRKRFEKSLRIVTKKITQPDTGLNFVQFRADMYAAVLSRCCKIGSKIRVRNSKVICLPVAGLAVYKNHSKGQGTQSLFSDRRSSRPVLHSPLYRQSKPDFCTTQGFYGQQSCHY